MKPTLAPNRRILLVDDNPAIHDDFRKVLLRDDSHLDALDADAALLFGEAAPAQPDSSVTIFEVESAMQGEEALEKVRAACESGRPYAMAFVDMRMPPGWDGMTTIVKLWEVDPMLQVVICTAYSDRSWGEIQRTLTARDRWLVVKKPFDQIEVLQLAHALTEKWNLTRDSQRHAEMLELQVRARTEELVRLTRVKDQFFANVTHEMLTPLNGVIGMLELMASESLPPDLGENVAVARGAADTLFQLINQILVLNDAAAGAVCGSEIEGDPREWGEEVCARFSDAADRAGVTVRIHCPDTVPTRVACPGGIISRVLDALVDNAVKFSRDGGVVTLEVTWRPAPATRALQFTVVDQGVGMTAQQLELIRIPFAQVDGGSNRRGTGAGLGLTLARRLLSLIESELIVQSKPGEGTRMSFALRARALDSAAPGRTGEVSRV
jgi:signal transduction histidine kinase